MDNAEILSHIDHTALGAAADLNTIETLCEQALALHTASVCIPAAYVRRMHEKFGSQLNICTVIGFPLGYSTTQVKVFEARDAVDNGAQEIDMVINLGDVKNAEFEKIEQEIHAVKDAIGTRVLKVIVETCLLTTAEKIALCGCVTRGGADFIKTSTGFGTAGAELADIALFREHIGANVRIKAAGGIRTREAMEAFLAAGCERIGTSSAAALFL